MVSVYGQKICDVLQCMLIYQVLFPEIESIAIEQNNAKYIYASIS